MYYRIRKIGTDRWLCPSPTPDSDYLITGTVEDAVKIESIEDVYKHLDFYKNFYSLVEDYELVKFEMLESEATNLSVIKADSEQDKIKKLIEAKRSQIYDLEKQISILEQTIIPK